MFLLFYVLTVCMSSFQCTSTFVSPFLYLLTFIIIFFNLLYDFPLVLISQLCFIQYLLASVFLSPLSACISVFCILALAHVQYYRLFYQSIYPYIFHAVVSFFLFKFLKEKCIFKAFIILYSSFYSHPT